MEPIDVSLTNRNGDDKESMCDSASNLAVASIPMPSLLFRVPDGTVSRKRKPDETTYNDGCTGKRKPGDPLSFEGKHDRKPSDPLSFEGKHDRKPSDPLSFEGKHDPSLPFLENKPLVDNDPPPLPFIYDPNSEYNLSSFVVRWKDKAYKTPQTARLPLQQCIENLFAKMHTEEWKQTMGISKDEVEFVDKLMEGMVSFFNYAHPLIPSEWPWNLRTAKSNNKDGIYMAVYPPGTNVNDDNDQYIDDGWGYDDGGGDIFDDDDDDGPLLLEPLDDKEAIDECVDSEFKVGMSQNIWRRLKQQGKVFAAVIMTVKELKMLVPPELVSFIKDLQPPRLACHPDKEELLDCKILRQVGEALYACCLKGCVTNTVMEQIIPIPSLRIKNAMAPDVPIEAIEFMKDIPKEGSSCLLGWPTMPSYLRANLKETGDEFLSARLHPFPHGEFVTQFLYMQIFQSKYQGFEDPVKVPPRIYRDLDPLIETIRRLLQENASHNSIRCAFEAIQGDNKDHYVHDTPKERADGAKPILEKWIGALPTNHVVPVEWKTVKSIKCHYGEWWNQTVKEDEGIAYGRSLLVRTTLGHRLVVTRCFFIAFAEKTSNKDRMAAVEEILAILELMIVSNNYSQQELEHVREYQKILCAFFMAIENNGKPQDKHSESIFYSARYMAFGNGWFKSVKRNVLTVSKNLGINALDAIYLFKQLGKEDFGKVLPAFGIQQESPMDLEWKCPGAPAVGKIAADPCPRTQDNQDDDDVCNVMCGAKIGPGHGFYGTWCCQKCHRKYDHRELAKFRLQDPSTLTAAQAERKQILEKRTKDHCDKEAERRANDTEKARAESRGKQERRNQSGIASGQSRKNNPNTVSAQKKREPGKHRASRSTKPFYPQAMQPKFVRGLQLLIHVLGKKPGETLYIHAINKVMFRIVKHEREWLRRQGVVFKVPDRGMPHQYGKKEVTTAMKIHLTKAATYLWQIKDDYTPIQADDLAVTPGANMDGIVRRVLEYMYPDYETMDEEDFDEE